MKKSVRILLLLLVVILTATSLCGCEEIEQARKTHGYYDAYGNVILNGVRYVPITVNEYFTVDTPESCLHIDVTEQDVPLLLKDTLGRDMTLSKDEIFLCNYDFETYYYCREDKFAEFNERMTREFVPDGYYYDYGIVNDEGYYGDSAYYQLTPQEVEAVNTILGQQPLEIPESMISEYTVSVQLFTATKDLYFRNYFVNLQYEDGVYTFVRYDNSETLYVDEIPMAYVYEIPASMNSVFADIMQKAEEANDKLVYY